MAATTSNNGTSTSNGSSAAMNGSASNQAFCLRRSNHGNDVLRDFSLMLEEEDLIDVTLSCEDGSIGAHRLMLSANSPYFKSVFARLALSPSKTQYPVVILKDLPFSDLKAILDFIYRGEVTVPQSQLASLLKSAESLKIRGLNGIEGVSENGTLTRTKKKRKKRRRTSSTKTSSDGDGAGHASDEDGISGSDESGNGITSDEDEDLRTHITAVDGRNSVSTVGDMEPSRLLEQSMTINDNHNNQNTSHNVNSSGHSRAFHPPVSSSANGLIDANALISQLDSLNESMAHHSSANGLLGFETHVPVMSAQSAGLSRSSHPGESRSFGPPSGSILRPVVNSAFPLDIHHHSVHHPLHPAHHSLGGSSGSGSGGGGTSNQSSLSLANDLIRRSRYQCPVCFKAFSEKGNMKRHTQIHAQQRHRYVCDLCSKCFSWKDNFNRHRRTHHI